MNSGLESLLTVRERAEENAEKQLAAAMAVHAETLAAQQRLQGTVAAVRLRLQAEKRRKTALTRVADALEREAYLSRLDAELRRKIDEAEAHRRGPLAAAAAAEDEARRQHLEARREREALEKHRAKQQAEARTVADRRAEDAAGDLAQAAHLRRTR